MPNIILTFKKYVEGKTLLGVTLLPVDGEYPETKALVMECKTFGHQSFLIPGYDDEGNPGEATFEVLAPEGKIKKIPGPEIINVAGYVVLEGSDDCFPFIATNKRTVFFPVRNSDGKPGVMQYMQINSEGEVVVNCGLCQVH